jgi:type IV pilus assembly protein PilO
MRAPAFLAPIVNASRSRKLLLGLIGLAIIGVGSIVLLISPARARVAGLEIRHAALQRELAQARAQVADLVRYRREVAELEKRLALITEKLPTQREIPPLYRTTYDAASKAGLAVALFQPKDPRVQDYYTEIPIAITAEGTYHQVGEFLETVAGFPRLVTVGDMKMTGIGKAKTTLRADITLATFVYRPVGSPAAPKPGVTKPGTPPPTPGQRTDAEPNPKSGNAG